jgi:hypothetical protein
LVFCYHHHLAASSSPGLSGQKVDQSLKKARPTADTINRFLQIVYQVRYCRFIYLSTIEKQPDFSKRELIKTANLSLTKVKP